MSIYAIKSGFLAASASVAGKVTFDFSSISLVSRLAGNFLIDELSVRGLFFLLMLAVNSWMLSSYVFAMEISSSALTPTVVNFATNFIFSVVFSVLFFSEGGNSLKNEKWWLGASLIISGVVLILADNRKNRKPTSSDGQGEVAQKTDIDNETLTEMTSKPRLRRFRSKSKSRQINPKP